MKDDSLDPFSTLGLTPSKAAPPASPTQDSLKAFDSLDSSALAGVDGSRLEIFGDSLTDSVPLEIAGNHLTDSTAPEMAGNHLTDSATAAPSEPPASKYLKPIDSVDPAPPEVVDESIPRIAGYEILSRLGRGGMGVVYRARQISLKRFVALKMIRNADLAGAEHLSRFQVEAEAIASLQHPNIVQIYEIGNANGQPYFSLELVEGGTLAQKLTNRLLSFRQAGELTVTLARAVHSAHERGVIHRDLKPANVLLTKEGAPKIADFGLAKQMETDDSESSEAGRVLGTPSYLSPEQALGRTDVGPASDVYSLGSMLYEMVTGRPPFRGESVRDTLNMVINDEPVTPARLRPKVPRDLETICLKCLEKDPKKRYPSASDLADDLQRWLDGDPILARPMGRTERTWRWCWRNPVPTSLLLAITFGAAVGLTYVNRQSNRLTQATALEGAAQQAAMLDITTDYYSSQVADRLKGHHVLITNDYTHQKQPAIPNPATLTIEVGDRISERNMNGMEVRLYSDYPFPSRRKGGMRDEFERMALDRLRANPTEPVYSFEEYHGMPVLRYATARVMSQSCIDCHNTHPDSPKKDWELGDVRGAVEIIRPLNRDEERASQGLWEGLLLTGGVAASMLVLTAFLLMLGNRRRVRTAK